METTMTKKEEFVLSNHAEILRHWFENDKEDHGLNLGHEASTLVAFLDSEEFGDADGIIDIWVKVKMGYLGLDSSNTFDLYVSAYGVSEQYLCTCDERLYQDLIDEYGFAYPIQNTIVTAVDLAIIKVSAAAQAQGYNPFTSVDVKTGHVESVIDGETHIGQVCKTWDTKESYFSYYGIEEVA